MKAKLSRYLAAAAGGEDVLVTDRGKPLARLTGLGHGADHRSADLADLEQAGLVRAPLRELPADFFDRRRPEDPDAAVRSALIEERREGR